MKKFALAAVAAGTILGSMSGTAVAGPEADGPSGFLCGFSSISNPTGEAGTQTGEIDGGPLVVVDADGNVGSGTLTCTIQTGTNDTHAEADEVGVSGHGTGVVTAGPAVVSYPSSTGQNVWLCSQFTYDGGATLYYHADNDGDETTDTGHWSTDATSQCGLAISADTGPATDPLDGVFDLLNATVCPILLSIPEIGDELAAIWEDCEPYGPILP